ncbi:MAG: DUF6364 family protein [Desulfobia sp.]
MNITLSADEKIIKKAREYAVRHGTSLNKMIRGYMEQLVSVSNVEQNAEEFARLAREQGRASPAGFVFNREEAHERKEGK